MNATPIKSILIANRGEIAVRIIRAARELGIKTVQAHSAADSQSLAVKMADVAVEIGPPPASKSYLNATAILKAASDHEVDAVHPGYGFFAENADFADSVVAAGMIFIGCQGPVIRQMGDKVAARQIAEAAGVATVPGSAGRIGDMETARQIAITTGFPLMIKAAAGGGGRGIRIVETLDEFEMQAPQASAEAKTAFGDGGLYLEKLISQARHIEVQILGDGERVVHLFERECSLQRRCQKIWEEAPAAMLSKEVRARLCLAAVRLAEAVKYQSVGTVEFLYDERNEEFYFIEMNTRIQVEHPVSEWITGIDLIREMIHIAGGSKLSFSQDAIGVNGHAIEVRINAEDPSKDFLPFPGVVSEVCFPGGPGVRFDGMIYPSYVIPPFYDSLLGKLIVWDTDRAAAIARLQRALAEFQIGGVATTLPLFKALAKDTAVRNGDFHTKWLESWLKSHSAKLKEREVDQA